LLLAVESELESEKVAPYKRQLKRVFDAILEKGCNEDGMMYNTLKGSRNWNDRLSDGWGYNYVGYICYDMIVGEAVYRPHIERTLRNLAKPKYQNYAWEGTSIDGFADSVEGGIYVLNRYPVKEGFDWADSEVAANIAWSGDPLESAELWGTMKLQANGVRTVIMHALMHTRGLIARPWSLGMELGACPSGDGLVVAIGAKKDYQGKIVFDIKRHKHYVRFAKDWPRMNTLPEWYTVELEKSYKVTDLRSGKAVTYTGRQLHAGLPIRLKATETATLCVEPI